MNCQPLHPGGAWGMLVIIDGAAVRALPSAFSTRTTQVEEEEGEGEGRNGPNCRHNHGLHAAAADADVEAYVHETRWPYQDTYWLPRFGLGTPR